MIPHFAYQASLHKDIWIPTLNDLLAHAFSIPTKWHIFVLHLSKYFEYLLSMPIFDMYLYHAIPSDRTLRWHLVEHPEHPCSYMWQKCQQGYNPQRHQPHNHFELRVHEPACPLQVLINLHMHWAPEQKVNWSRVMPFCCISWKSSIVFSCCPALTTYLASHLFNEKQSSDTPCCHGS
jgi:hypothetical protein